MKGLSWQVETIEDGWAELRGQAFLFLVPIHRLPADVGPGDRVVAEDQGSLLGYPTFRGDSGGGRRRAAGR